jgi:hypothetical protein
MRKIVLPLAMVAAAALALPAVSQARPGVPQQFTASVSPTKGGTKKKPRAVTLKVRPFFDVDTVRTFLAGGGTPWYTDTADVFFPRDAQFNGKAFPQCSKTQVLTDDKKCPRGSQVGTGKAAGFALGILQELEVTVYNGPRGNKVELLVTGETPLTIRDVIEGRLVKQRGKYGFVLKVDVPPGLESPATGVKATLVDFDVTLPARSIRKGGKRIPYVATTGCTGRRWAFGYTGKYDDGTTSTVEITQRCRR